MMARFLTISLWETLQNIPFFIAFTVAARFVLVRRGSILPGLVILLAAALATAILIEGTEHLITDHLPTPVTFRAVLTSALIFSALAGVALVYLHLTADSRWWVDMLFALVMAVILSTAQAASGGFAAWSPIAVGHVAAMTVTGILFLSAIRHMIALPDLTLTIWASFLMTLVVSLAIAVIDYGPLIFARA